MLVEENVSPRIAMVLGGWSSYDAIEPYLAAPTEANIMSDIGTRVDAEASEHEGEPLEKFAPISERLEQNEFSVSHDADTQKLCVEKYGVEHVISQN